VQCIHLSRHTYSTMCENSKNYRGLTKRRHASSRQRVRSNALTRCLARCVVVIPELSRSNNVPVLSCRVCTRQRRGYAVSEHFSRGTPVLTSPTISIRRTCGHNCSEIDCGIDALHCRRCRYLWTWMSWNAYRSTAANRQYHRAGLW